MEKEPKPDPNEKSKRIREQRIRGLLSLCAGIGILTVSLVMAHLGDIIFSPLGIGMGFVMTTEGAYELLTGTISPVKKKIQQFIIKSKL